MIELLPQLDVLDCASSTRRSRASYSPHLRRARRVVTFIPSPRVALRFAVQRADLEALRLHVLHLHKAIVDSEREDLERLEGRLTGHQFLDRLLHDPAFTWLKPLSASLVAFDEYLDAEADPSTAAALIDELRALLVPDPAGDDFARRYADLLQRPTIILAHAAATASLPR